MVVFFISACHKGVFFLLSLLMDLFIMPLYAFHFIGGINEKVHMVKYCVYYRPCRAPCCIRPAYCNGIKGRGDGRLLLWAAGQYRF